MPPLSVLESSTEYPFVHPLHKPLLTSAQKISLQLKVCHLILSMHFLNGVGTELADVQNFCRLSSCVMLADYAHFVSIRYASAACINYAWENADGVICKDRKRGQKLKRS